MKRLHIPDAILAQTAQHVHVTAWKISSLWFIFTAQAALQNHHFLLQYFNFLDINTVLLKISINILFR